MGGLSSLFGGTPQTVPSTSGSATTTPSWLQDAIYNQIQAAQNVAAIPYQPYTGQLVASTSPMQQQAYQDVENNQGAWQGALNQQSSALGNINYNAGLNAAQPYLDQALTSGGGLKAAQPYLDQASQNTSGLINQFMNPYTQGVTDQIASLGARNLQENLLPAVSDAFVNAGQFGGNRMGEFGERAVRDTQTSVLNQQAQLMAQNYAQALQAAQQQQGLYAQLGATAGSLGNQQQANLISGASTLGGLQNQAVSNQLSGAAQYGQIANNQANLSAQDAAQLAAAGQAQQQQQQNELNAQYQQYMNQVQYPQQQLNFLSGQLTGLGGLVPSYTTGYGTTTQYGASPLSTIAGLASGAAGLFGGSSGSAGQYGSSVASSFTPTTIAPLPY